MVSSRSVEQMVRSLNEQGSNMQRQAVTSETIKEIGYDPERSTLELLFHDGDVYQYYNFTAEDHRQLMSAPSKGRHFNQSIKKQFRFSKV